MTTNIMRLGFWLTVLFIVAVSLTPSGDFTSPGVVDKIGHFAAYAVLVYLGLTTFSSRKARIPVILFAVTLGIVLELLQTFVSGRDASSADSLANLLGTLTGAAVHFIRKSFIDRRKKGVYDS